MHKYSKGINTTCFPSVNSRLPRNGRGAEQGVALVITLLTLSLITALSIGMVIAFSSQTLIGGYYRNYRGAFYAADSGLNIARQKAGAELQAAMPTVFSMPPANAAACAAPSNVTVGTAYATNTSLNTGTASTSWSEKFRTFPAPPILPANGVTWRQHLYVHVFLRHHACNRFIAPGAPSRQTVEETGKICRGCKRRRCAAKS